MSRYFVTYTDLIKRFLDGATEGLSGGTGHNRKLRIDGELLIHYDTTMAERDASKIIINNTYYSLQSRKVQKILMEIIPENKRIVINGVEKGYGEKLSSLV